MSRLFVLLLLPILLSADEHWVEIHSGPFDVLSSAGDKPARETMNELEQFRYALGQALGKSDLQLVWPVRILIFKNTKQIPAGASFGLARDAYVGVHVDLAQLARLFIDQNTKRLPAGVEKGLIDLFSTVQVNGTHITLGAPIPAPQRTRDWARMHLLSVDPTYAGRTRVLVNNLEQGSDLDVAYRNAFEKSSAEIEKQLDAYMAAGTFGTTSVSGRALSPVRDFHLETVEADKVKIALADLSRDYNSFKGPEAAEGLGLQALQAKKQDEALRLFQSALESESTSARAWYEAGLLEPSPAKARREFEKAAELNPRWAEPPYQIALLESDLDRQVSLLQKATSIDSRNVKYWEQLAKFQADATRFIEAQKAWGGAERAAATPEEREQIRKLRLQLEGNRAQHDADERKRIAEEEAADLARVKNASMAAIHQAEQNARKRLNPDGTAPPTAVEWYSDSTAGTKAEGTLQRFDCIGKQARLVIQTADAKTVQILVGDPTKIVLTGGGSGGQTSLACGVQKPARKVLVLYNPKPDKKLGTVGEATSIEFH